MSKFCGCFEKFLQGTPLAALTADRESQPIQSPALTLRFPLACRIALLGLTGLSATAAEPVTFVAPGATLVSTFEGFLPQQCAWSLGTWKLQDGVLRGFESGPRRHGPVTVHKLDYRQADIRFEFRLVGKAAYVILPMDGSRERGHILNVVLARKSFRIIAHPAKGQSLDLVRETIEPPHGEWQPVHVVLRSQTVTVEYAGRTWTATHPAVAEVKAGLGLGGDSGGPEGEKAGAIEFRHLQVVTQP